MAKTATKSGSAEPAKKPSSAAAKKKSSAKPAAKKEAAKPAAKKAKPTANAKSRQQKQAQGQQHQQQEQQQPKDKRSSAAADVVVKLLESPLAVDLIAVGATAALAAITEKRFGRSSDAQATTSTVKAAGKAAAAAMGRRIAGELDQIMKASKEPKGGG